MTTIHQRKGAQPSKAPAKSHSTTTPCRTLTAAYWTLLPMMLICFMKSTMTYVIKAHVMITLVELYPGVLHIAGAWTFWTCSLDLFLRVPVQAALRRLPPIKTFLSLGVLRMSVAGVALWQFAKLRAAVVGASEPGGRPAVFHLTVVMALVALETLLVKCSIDRFKLDWIHPTAVLCDKQVNLGDYEGMVTMTRLLGSAVSITWTMKHESILAPLALPINRTFAFIGINLSLCMFQMVLAIYVHYVNPYVGQTYEYGNKNRDISFYRDVSSRVKKEFHQVFSCYLKKGGRKTLILKRMFLTMTENFILNDFSWVFLVGVCKKQMGTISSYLNLMSGLEYFSSTQLLPSKQTMEGHQKTLSKWLVVMLAAYGCVAAALWLPLPMDPVALTAYGGAYTTTPFDNITSGVMFQHENETASVTMTAVSTALNAKQTATTTATNATMTATTTAPNATMTATTTAPNATMTATTTAPNATMTATTTAHNVTMTSVTTAPNVTMKPVMTAPNVPVIVSVPVRRFDWKTNLFYTGMITVAMTAPHVKGLTSFLSERGPVTDDFEDGQLLSYVIADLSAGIVGSSVTFALNHVEYYKFILSCWLLLTVLGLSSWFQLWLPHSWLRCLGVLKNDLHDQ